MYFPYLRGRQFELIALRELVENTLLNNKIIPIIEPVKLSNTLLKTLQVFQDANQKIALVRNPQVGKFISELKKKENVHLKSKLYDLVKSENIIDVYILNDNSEEHINILLDKGSNICNIITICDNEDYIPTFERIFSSEKPMYSLIPDESIFRRRIRHNRVMMDDRFKKQSRNTDYSDLDDEPFSSDHLYYFEDGYVGFSDYSIIGNEYTETGFAPYAVAIHIVYFDDNNSLRIKHFVSDTNDDITDPAGKFSEALNKLIEWNKIFKLKTHGIKTFKHMYKIEKYPGLGTVKKLSIMHHLELMGNYLDKGLS